MQSSRFSILRVFPFYPFLLPVFFLLHGYTEFYDLISLPKAMTLVFYYLLGAAFIVLIFKLSFKAYSKAAIFTFLILCLYFFFGSFHDFLNKKSPGSFITRYSFLLPFIVILFVAAFILLKKIKSSFYKITLYLNILLFLLLLIDAVTLTAKINNQNKSFTARELSSLKPCNDCPKPDIYLIVTDGYSGRIALQKNFNYDNRPFEEALKERGFFIADSSFSNYNYTVFSIGSLLNMNYLQIPGYFNGKKDLPVAFDAVRNSKVIKYLRKENYDIYNYSLFDIKGTTRIVRSTLMDFEKSPLTTQTFLYRLNRDLGYHLITTFNMKFLQHPADDALLLELTNNSKIDSLTTHIFNRETGKPRFVYSHFVMPHWPYYYDSTGKRIPDHLLTDAHHADKKAYTSYLKYVNRKLLELIGQIQSNNKRPAIIILLSDHGCRECLESDPQKENAELLNLNAVYFPDKNYSGFYKSISNVNLFRIVLNTQFKKDLSLLKDSLILMKKE